MSVIAALDAMLYSALRTLRDGEWYESGQAAERTPHYTSGRGIAQAFAGLIRRGLVEKIDRRGKNPPLFRITDLGREVLFQWEARKSTQVPSYRA